METIKNSSRKEKAIRYTDLSCEEFTERLASKSAVPGGGGASALVGALSASLANMVGNLTFGKKKYADVEICISDGMRKLDLIRSELLALVERDAVDFKPLAAAYGLPAGTEEEKAEKARVMEAALLRASKVPLETMETVCEAISLIEEFAEKGSRIAISDAGAAAAFAAAALRGASLNVFINTKSMKDREKAKELNERAESMLESFLPKADAVFDKVKAALTPGETV